MTQLQWMGVMVKGVAHAAAEAEAVAPEDQRNDVDMQPCPPTPKADQGGQADGETAEAPQAEE